MSMKLSLIGVCLLLAVGVLASQPQCSPKYDLKLGVIYDVLNAESDKCQTRFPTPPGGRALWVSPYFENLVIDPTGVNEFYIFENGPGNIDGIMYISVQQGENKFTGNITFTGFQGKCAQPLLELADFCYEFLPYRCYQCFSNWTGILVGTAGSVTNATLYLVGRAEKPEAQTGLGANNKNKNFGLSGWCNWELVGIVAGYDNTESYKPKKDRVCDINVDLYKRREPQVKGDPHFVGFRGQKYDFHGEVDGVFNIITDINFHLNARFVNADLRPKKVHKTYIGDVGVLIGSHRVQFSCNRGAEYHKILLDDQPLERGIAFTLSDENNAIILRDASDKVLIDSYPYTIRLWFSSSRHSSCHINMKASYVAGSHEYPHGVLGQTADPSVVAVPETNSLQGEGVIEGNWMDYRIEGDDLFGTSFKYNRFDPSQDIRLVDDDEMGETLTAASV